MFKKEVAQRAARVMGNVIREPISKKDHELMQSYLKGPRQMSPQVSLEYIILLLYSKTPIYRGVWGKETSAVNRVRGKPGFCFVYIVYV